MFCPFSGGGPPWILLGIQPNFLSALCDTMTPNALYTSFANNMLMADKNFVCTVCSQTFTRMWRGRVHNHNLHGGHSEIVRLIDYMVGRLNGLYSPSNPSDYRKKNRSLLSDRPQGTASASEQLLRRQETIIKTAKLKEILSRCFPPGEVQEILSMTSYHCTRKGNNGPLDDAIRKFSKADEVRKATEYLRKS
jgi:hypothetical protein